jgi:hypothetical protein
VPLWLPDKIQEVEMDKILFLLLVLRMDIGANPLPFLGSGFAPGGLNVNNNGYDNENNGVGGSRKSCIFPR